MELPNFTCLSPQRSKDSKASEGSAVSADRFRAPIPSSIVSPSAHRVSAEKDSAGAEGFVQSTKFNLTSHVLCLCAFTYNKSALVAVGMTDGSIRYAYQIPEGAVHLKKSPVRLKRDLMTHAYIRFFDASINAQVSQYQAAERGSSLITALEACCLTSALDGTGKVLANIVAVGFDCGHVQLLNADIIHKEVLGDSERASSACDIIKRSVFTAAESGVRGGLSAGASSLSRTGSRTGSASLDSGPAPVPGSEEKSSVSVIVYVPEIHALCVGSLGGKVARLDLDGVAYNVTCFNVHNKAVRAIAYVAPYKYICSSGTDRDILIWEPVCGRSISRLHGHFSPVTKLLYHEDTDLLCSLDTQSNIKWWDLSTEAVVYAFAALADPYLTLRMPIISMLLARPHTGVHAGQDSFILCCKRLRLWRLRGNNKGTEISSQEPAALAVPLTGGVETRPADGGEDKADSQSLPSAPEEGQRDGADDEHKGKPGRVHKNQIVSVLVSKSSSSIIGVDMSGLVVVWDMKTWEQKSWFQAERPVRSACTKKVDGQSSEGQGGGRAAADVEANLGSEDRPRRPFEIVRSAKKRNEKRDRPWASAPRSIFLGGKQVRPDAAEDDGQAREEVVLTAATLDLLQVRLVLGWSNGAVEVYNFSSGSLLQELISDDSCSEIIGLGVVERGSAKLSDVSREAGAFIVAADEAGALWLWPHRARKEDKKVKFVRRLADRDSFLDDSDNIVACKTSPGMIATGASNGRITHWSLAAGKVVSKINETSSFDTQTGALRMRASFSLSLEATDEDWEEFLQVDNVE